MENLRVLYEDNHVIAVYKPAGVPAQPDTSGDESILEAVKKYIKEVHHKPGNVFLGLLHRLDRPVAGVMLFAKTSKGASRLSEQFRQRTIRKKYQALVVGKPKEIEGLLVHRLGKDEKLKKAKVYADGEEVRLIYRLLKSNNRYSLLEVEIESGKFHQIRAQLSLAGLPIVGDIKYGAPEPLSNKEIALVATEMVFCSATENKLITVSIPSPKAWDSYFKT